MGCFKLRKLWIFVTIMLVLFIELYLPRPSSLLQVEFGNLVGLVLQSLLTKPQYTNTLMYFTSEAFSNIPAELIMDLQRMLSMDAASRPSALDFTGSSFFPDDTRLRALHFLDHLLERDNMQKTEFLKALSDMWKHFDARVLRYMVLPPLCAEL